MEFKSIIEAHDSNPWQFIQSPILIGNIKTQNSLAISKPNWQYQNSILIGNIKTQFSLALLYQKEKSLRLSTLGKKKKYHVTVARKDHGNHLMKKLIESYLEDYVLIS